MLSRLGKVIDDDGDRKIIKTTIKTMISIGVKRFELQRELDEDHLQKLIRYQNKQIKIRGKPKIRGNLLIGKVRPPLISFDSKNDDCLYILDGQHRYRTFEKLVEDGTIDDVSITIEFIEVNNQTDLFDEFKEINESKPVPVHNLKRDEIINGATEMLIRDYPDAFARRGNYRRPKISVDEFKNVLINKKVVDKLGIKTSNELKEKIKELNKTYENEWGLTKLQDRIARKNVKERKTVENCFKKCVAKEKNKECKYLFIGLFKNCDWVTDLLE